jgi:hypothetical protein
MCTITPSYHMYKDIQREKFKRVMRHIKLISMNSRLFWMHLKVNEVDQGAVHVHHDPLVLHVQGQAHEEVQEVITPIKLICMNKRLFWMH